VKNKKKTDRIPRGCGLFSSYLLCGNPDFFSKKNIFDFFSKTY